MEPYVIICDSCTARLKVTNEALIGQRLACPKCQSMVKVVAPEGFVPNNERAAKESKVEDSSAEDSLSGNFEDIDSLLASAQSSDRSARKKPANAKSKLSPPPSPEAAARAPRPAKAPKPSSAKPQTPEPQTSMMSGAQWDTESTKQKKRILQIVMLSLLGLVTLGIGLWAIIGGGAENNSSVPVAKNDDTSVEIVGGDTSAAPAADLGNLKPEESAASTSQPDKGGVSETLTKTTDAGAVDTASPLSGATALDTSPQVDDSAGASARTSAPPPLPSSPEPSQLADSARAITPAEPNNPLATQLPATNNLQSDTDPIATEGPLIASTENSLGTLSKILKGQGTSLQEIEDIAEIQKERALIGTPTYWIERPDNKPIQIARQLSAELSGWKLDNVPLIDAVGDLEMLSGIPVSIDPKLFRDGGFDILRPVSLKVETITFEAAFEMLLGDAGLILEPTTSGLRITSPVSSDVVMNSYPQSFCANEKSAQRLKELIIAVTGINDWDDQEQYELNVSPDSVTVSHWQTHQDTIADLLTKLSAAAAYKSNPAALEQTLRPLALKAEGTLAAPPNLKAINPYRRTMRIGSLLRNVRNTTKLKTIIDWESLTEQGWFPNTQMPGRINEPTNRALMDQLGHAMELTSVVIGTDTIMLTTFENAGRQRDIEVYSVGDVIDSKMTPQQLDQLMTETLGIDQLTPPNATVIYFAECKCLVANAPQIIQRQISSIVDELAAP